MLYAQLTGPDSLHPWWAIPIIRPVRFCAFLGRRLVGTGAQLCAVSFGKGEPMPSGASYDVQILLPIHNEAVSIEATIEELYGDLSPQVNLQFLLFEDGSKDNTKQILRGVATRRPAKLLLSEGRKGYSLAVRDGMQENDAPYLLCLDSDGQCD